ncbi:MAG: 5-formyltetrahydrofolate cyclo-ligase [Burkholderiales bacterium]|nr:5-formyltetrahydrofolate cyclo-ligase [Burkholderiales bacterium]
MAEAPGSAQPSVALAKAELRARVLAARDALPAPIRAAASATITGRVVRLEGFSTVRSVLAYSSFGSEFDTGAFNAHVIGSGRQLVLPRVDRTARRLRLYAVDDLERDLLAGTWGIREPDPESCREVTIDDVDFVLVPGVAFDAHGRRLGYGGGFYDRLLALTPAELPRVVAAFSVQVVDDVPTEAHDCAMTTLVTERETTALR